MTMHLTLISLSTMGVYPYTLNFFIIRSMLTTSLRDEWVAHMNAVTKKARRDLWRGMNFAGTIDWAVDLQGDSGSGEGGEVVYIGPEVYSTGVAQCTPPCIMVFPPSSLSAPTTISPPPYTSSLEVGGGGGGGGGVVVTRTVTVTIQPVTVTEMPYENYWVSSSDVVSRITTGFVYKMASS